MSPETIPQPGLPSSVAASALPGVTLGSDLLTTLGRNLVADLDIGRTLTKTIEGAQRLLDADIASICLLAHPTGDVQQVTVDSDGSTRLEPLRPQSNESPVVLEPGQILHRRSACSACRLLSHIEHCVSTALVSGGENLGILCAMRRSERPEFDPLQQQALHTYAEWAALAIVNSRRFHVAQEEARQKQAKIAAHLHDNAVQALSILGLKVELIEAELAESETAEVSKHLKSVKSISQQMIHQLRAAFGELQQPPIGSGDLISSLTSCVEDFRQSTQISAEMVVVGVCNLADEQSTQAAQIVREALHNVRRHAQAKQVQVHVVADAAAVRISVQDNGTGFDLHRVGADQRHLGATLMRERAQRSGGFLTIQSHPGRGTNVTISYPIH